MKKSFNVLMLMKFGVIPLLFMTLSLTMVEANNGAAQAILDKTVSIELDNVSMKKALAELEKEADVYFTYRTVLIKSIKKVSLKADNARLKTVLSDLLKPYQINFKVYSDNNIVLTKNSLI